jgi:hypothetical protein
MPLGYAVGMPHALRFSILCATIIAAAVGAACADEEQPIGRPDDGTVEPWGSCRWQGSNTPSLCEPWLFCTDYGVCAPPCDKLSDCVQFEFGDKCEPESGTGAQSVCIISCDAAGQCPQTGGAELRCSTILDTCIQ